VAGSGRAIPIEGRPRLKQRAEIFRREGRATVTKVIEFYIPNTFRKRVKWVSPAERGKIIEFPAKIKKSA
jgi:hypothetical protein